TDAAVEVATDVAIPHARIDGKLRVIRRYWANNMDVFAAVGGINSSVNDMSHWLEMLLADGQYDGRKVLDPAVIQSMETAQIPIPAHTWIGDWLRTQTPGSHFYAYGYGFMLQDYGKYKVVWHAGDINGFATAMVLVPSLHLGVIALSNMNQNRAPEGVVFRVLQDYLGLPHFDVSQALYDARQKAEAKDKAAMAKLAATREKNARPTRPLSAYASDYQDKFYGTAKVSLEQGRLVLRLGNPDFTGDLEPWHDNTFRVVWRDAYYGKDYVTFDLDAMGTPETLRFASAPMHYQRLQNTVTAATP
ncbi:MAG: DUF3471 domain-containing protein, partial [Gammaproteobacteria bacterium]|nr:DUF3471 domain-containing protein [Gammaproteobacteria bacterium]